MKLRDWFGVRHDVTAAYSNPSALPIVSPWADSKLASVVFEDIFGVDYQPVTRAQAMRLPPVARSRNLIVSTTCRIPMREMTEDGPVPSPEQPAWLSATRSSHPAFRIAWTVDDLIFYGRSLWSRNPLTNEPGDRIDIGRWSFDGDGHVILDGQIATHGEVIVFGGLHEGILSFGKTALQDAATLYQNVRNRLSAPLPPIDLHQTGGDELTHDQIDELISRWIKARQSANGAVGFTNPSVEARVLDVNTDAQLMIEARNAAALDLARVVGVAGSRIDATSPKSTLNYETTTGRNQEFVDFDIALYMTPIAARLSMDDVVAPGHSVAFDLGDFTGPTPSPTGPTLQD